MKACLFINKDLFRTKYNIDELEKEGKQQFVLWFEIAVIRSV